MKRCKLKVFKNLQQFLNLKQEIKFTAEFIIQKYLGLGFISEIKIKRIKQEKEFNLKCEIKTIKWTLKNSNK
jgi:hypothetical protein